MVIIVILVCRYLLDWYASPKLQYDSSTFTFNFVLLNTSLCKHMVGNIMVEVVVYGL